MYKYKRRIEKKRNMELLILRRVVTLSFYFHILKYDRFIYLLFINIINVLMNCCKQYQKTPLYIVIDELLVLCNNKKINKCILDILAVARHYNVYLIGIAQRGLSIDMSFKNLFNSRLCFRQVEETSYRAILGYSIDNPNLQKREFILLSDYIYKGRTYDI